LFPPSGLAIAAAAAIDSRGLAMWEYKGACPTDTPLHQQHQHNQGDGTCVRSQQQQQQQQQHQPPQGSNGEVLQGRGEEACCLQESRTVSTRSSSRLQAAQRERHQVWISVCVWVYCIDILVPACYCQLKRVGTRCSLLCVFTILALYDMVPAGRKIERISGLLCVFTILNWVYDLVPAGRKIEWISTRYSLLCVITFFSLGRPHGWYTQTVPISYYPPNSKPPAPHLNARSLMLYLNH